MVQEKETVKSKKCKSPRSAKSLKSSGKKRDRQITGTGIEGLFNRAARISININAKLEEISYWRALAAKTQVIFGAVNSGGKTSRSGSRLEDCICKIADIEESLQDDISELIELKEKTMKIIDKIDIPEYRSLLIQRYVCGKKWDQVADSMGYSYVHIVNRLHPKALKKLSEIGPGIEFDD